MNTKDLEAYYSLVEVSNVITAREFTSRNGKTWKKEQEELKNQEKDSENTIVLLT